MNVREAKQRADSDEVCEASPQSALFLRLNNNYTPEPYSGCWIWTGNVRKGYGYFKVKGKQVAAHRLSWTLHRGAIPNELWVLHHCDTPACVNPDHLFLGTVQDNVADCVRKNRLIPIQGENNPIHKLSESDVLKIRSDKRSDTLIASQFGVSRRLIWAIKRRLHWKHIP